MNKPNFLIIPYDLIDDETINPVDEKLYGVIYWFTQLKNEKCNASNVALAKFVKTSPQTIQNSLTKLEEKGYIKRKYRDEKKKVRLEIVPLVLFAKVSPVDDTVSPPDDTQVSPVGDQSINNTSNKSKGYIVAQKSATRPPRNKNEKYKDPTPYSLSEYVLSMRASPHRYIRIVGEYADTLQTHLETKGQWRRFTDRNVRPAKNLEPFTDLQISKAFERIERSKYITKWTLETLEKYIE